MQTDLEFHFVATILMSRAAKSRALDNQMFGANLQTEGHTPIPSKGHEDLEEMGASGSAPSHSPSWSLARKPSPCDPDTQHCLGIHMTLTEEIGATLPPPHTWMVTIVKDMIVTAEKVSLKL